MALRPNRMNSKVHYMLIKFETCIDWSLNEMDRKKRLILVVTVQEMQKKGEAMGQ